jgi:hypothetical protein
MVFFSIDGENVVHRRCGLLMFGRESIEVGFRYDVLAPEQARPLEILQRQPCPTAGGAQLRFLLRGVLLQQQLPALDLSTRA